MRRNLTTTISLEGKKISAVILPQQRSNGLHYEVNVPGYPRFFLRWGAADRYELLRTDDAAPPPDALVLAVSDAIEAASLR